MTDYRVAYDLGMAPASWDFLNWLISVEIERRKANGGPLKVKFIPGPKFGFRNDSMARPLSARLAIFDNVMRPALRLVNAEETDEDPNQPSPHYIIKRVVHAVRNGSELPEWHIPEHPDVNAGIGNRRPIVITLREASYYPERNSNIDAWTKFARTCGDDVIFVRDTEKSHEPLPGFETSPRASCDFLFRAALMAKAKANLMVSNGPVAIAQYLKVPWLQFKVLISGIGYAPGRPEWWPWCVGIPAGGQYPWSDDRHAIVWKDDTFDNIKSAYEVMKEDKRVYDEAL